MLKIEDRVWDSIFGYIELTTIEKKVLNTDPVQRLRRINPTPGSSYVYPELTGTRFSHSLGVMHLAGRIIQQINHNDWGDEVIQRVRLAGLLHDIGHGPFSHTFDQFLNSKGIRTNHEQIGCRILMFHEEFEGLLSEEERYKIAYIAWGKRVLEKVGISREVIEKYSGSQEMNLFADIIHGPPHCADILDFLMRDSRHAGVVYGHVDIERLLAHMDNFEYRLGIEDKAFDAYESMILARYYMFKTVYFHRSSRAMELLLLEALEAIDEILREEEGKGFLDVVQGIMEGKTDDILRYMDFDDYFVYAMIRRYRSKNQKLHELADKIFHRDIPRRIYARKEREFEQKIRNLGINKEQLISLWKERIVDKAKERGIDITASDILVDIPSLTMIPIHAKAVTIDDLKKYLFTKKDEVKESFEPEISIIEKLDPKEYEIQIYVRKASKEERKKLEEICKEIWEETDENSEASTQA